VSRSARHNVILLIVALSGCLAAFGGWRFAKASAPVNGPIIVVSVDALRADRLRVYGYSDSRTPAIDALAADGAVFERAYAHVPQTLPAHVALLTGRLPFETGVRDSAGFTIPANARTLAELLGDRGYASGGIVSSFLLRKYTGINRGFAFFDDERPVTTGNVEASLTRTGVDSEEVAEHWLDSIGTTRAFLFLHLADLTAPASDNAAVLSSEYDARVTAADAAVGRLLNYLKARQIYDRSTIVLVADHGEGFGEHGEHGHGLLAFEESLRVPLVIKQPGGSGTGLRVTDPVQLIDLVPTVLDFAKAPGASGLRGRSLVPALSGHPLAATTIYAESLFGQYRFGWAPFTSVISGNYQLVTSGSFRQLLDLSVLPGERVDMSASHPETVDTLERTLAEFTRFKAPVSPAVVSASDRDRYEAFGYVGTPAADRAPDGAVSTVDRVGIVEQFRTAVRQAAVGDGRDALEIYTALSREEPANPDIWLHLAQTAAALERHELATSAYDQVLTLSPDSIAAKLGAAASQLRLRRHEDASVHAQSVLDSDRANPVEKAEAHEVLARVALNKKDPATARAEAQAAEAADPNRPVLPFVEGRIALDEGRAADASAAFQQALDAATTAHRPPLADLRVYAAEALIRVGRPSEAEALLEAELRAFPSNARARAALQALTRSAQRVGTSLAQH